MNVTSTSASQVKDYRGCARLWFWKNVVKKRPPQTAAQKRGTDVHTALEHSLKAPDKPPVVPDGFTAEEIADYLTALKPLVEKGGKVGLIEHRDELPTYEGGPKFVVIIDHAREVEVPNFGTIPQIDDLKTTSDFRYCKTPDELARDAQMVSYAKWALEMFVRQQMPPPEFVSVRHVYVRTRGKRVALERSRLMSPAEVEEQWQLVINDVKSMVALAQTAKKPADVLPNTSYCSAYGGCFFKPDCFGEAPKNLTEAFTRKEPDMTTTAEPSLMSRLRAKQGHAAPPAAAAAAAAPPATNGTTVVEGATTSPSNVIPITSGAPGSRFKRAATGAAPPLPPAAATPPAAEAPPAPPPAAEPAHAPPRVAGPPASRFARLANVTPSSAAPPPAAAPAAPPPATAAVTQPPAAAAAVAPVAPAGSACGASSAVFPGLACTLVGHIGDHESRSEKGGVVHWNAEAAGLGPSENWQPVTEAAAGATVAQVLPPDAPSRENAAPPPPAAEAAGAAAPAAPAPETGGRLKRTRRTRAQIEADNAAAAAAAAGAAGAAPAAPPAETAPPAAPAAPAPAPATTAAPAVPLLAGACQLEELFVDCMPTKGGDRDTVLGEDLLALIGQDIASDTPRFDPSLKSNYSDWRLIPYTSRGVLANAIRARLGEMPQTIVVSSSSAGADVLIEVLTPIARRVVRALRG